MNRITELALGVLADEVFGDPRRYHPVAGFGTVAQALEARMYAPSKLRGAAYTAILVGGAAALGYAARNVPGATAVGTWAVVGGAGLRTVGSTVGADLESGDIDGARTLLPSLCGRDPSVLDTAGLARAATESVAENTSDAAVAPLFWGAVAGLPGLFAYRAANTLDAMVGYRNDRYGDFGWASARLDDALNYVPARLAGAVTVALAPAVGGAPSDAARAWRRDAAKHPSPNAGVAEATAAGALGLRLGGRTQYAHGVELRPTLGDGRAPEPRDLARAARLSLAVELGALAATALCVRTGRRVARRARPRA
ncbi:cobalamin biosynthesis protein [Tsukamurella paurometabola]|uniref:Cobalamin biosynthesis protein CobD n=1 Tax=Tsukamurella paurometabola TaxID=2061 RepID=A0A3P8MC21_TSUPA|nr:cobalamin biosynthesis protein [Tsukamurella paurometabola]UEA82977.1 cobalamin biosynthesis protein [Tsukamurella paurometabola]VDR40060.1 cobalamin biosynthesis protein [Tsukamurella paurometabola]